MKILVLLVSMVAVIVHAQSLPEPGLATPAEIPPTPTYSQSAPYYQQPTTTYYQQPTVTYLQSPTPYYQPTVVQTYYRRPVQYYQPQVRYYRPVLVQYYRPLGNSLRRR